MQNFSLSTGQTENYSVSYEYNALGMPSALNFGGKVKNYSYIPGTGMLNQTTVKEGENTVMTGNYTYDQFKRVTGLSAVVGGTTHTFGYTLNDKNQRVGATLPNGKNWTFEYDTLGQLSGAIFKFNELAERTLSYDYDQIGNRTQAVEDSTTTNYTSNLLNQYTAIAATGATPEAPTYDADGNMLTNGEWAYTWNGENRLIALESATAKIEFDYDYMGRRYERRDYTKSGSEWVLNTTKHFVYSGFKLVAEYTNGVLESSYAWDVAGLDTPAFLKRDGSTYSYWSDGNKNILKLFSNTDAVAEYAYDPFGRITSTNGALALLNPFRFSSEYHNDSTGLVEYIYREYSPLLGRWLTKDPIMEKGGLNLYAMVGNGSIARWDSNGLFLDDLKLFEDLYFKVATRVDEYIELAKTIWETKIPKPPRSTDHLADWWEMTENWFFEKGENPAFFSKYSNESKDIASSYSMKEVLSQYCLTKENPKDWKFTGPGTATGNYGEVEWFIGSYTITDFSLSGQIATFKVVNDSTWHSATRLPKSWQDAIEKKIGRKINNFVASAPRGEVFKQKLIQELGPSILNVPMVESLLDKLPSFGGNWRQIYEIEMEWCCDETK